jgi:DnaJ-class molecular chaperone
MSDYISNYNIISPIYDIQPKYDLYFSTGKKTQIERKVILCDSCNGEGIDKINATICFVCKGTGRLFEITQMEIVREPFDVKKISRKNIRYALKK